MATTIDQLSLPPSPSFSMLPLELKQQIIAYTVPSTITLTGYHSATLNLLRWRPHSDYWVKDLRLVCREWQELFDWELDSELRRRWLVEVRDLYYSPLVVSSEYVFSSKVGDRQRDGPGNGKNEKKVALAIGMMFDRRSTLRRRCDGDVVANAGQIKCCDPAGVVILYFVNYFRGQRLRSVPS